MSNRHKHIANANWEDAGCMIGRLSNFSNYGHSKPLAPASRRLKKYYNRIGKRADARFHMESQA